MDEQTNTQPQDAQIPSQQDDMGAVAPVEPTSPDVVDNDPLFGAPAPADPVTETSPMNETPAEPVAAPQEEVVASEPVVEQQPEVSVAQEPVTETPDPVTPPVEESVPPVSDGQEPTPPPPSGESDSSDGTPVVGTF